ncbi:MAG: helix-turn-helix transcriptional regulator [Lachnospiraceae bacterium]|nr:helix-turn-helix transcriptional regulator [Lachnospiraceae bacterium]
MMRAYEETYLSDAMNNLGDMFNYAICDLGYDAEEFYSRFLVSGVAEKFGEGNPRYVAGFSGAELAGAVLCATEGKRPEKRPSVACGRSPEYWSGWILAYYQWFTGRSFAYMKKRGMTFSKVMSLYPTLHEADVTKFASVADKIIEKHRKEETSRLQQIRKDRGLTQRELAERSGTSLRMVQLYEQKQQDIRRAEAQTLVGLSLVLGCDVVDLLE